MKNTHTRIIRRSLAVAAVAAGLLAGAAHASAPGFDARMSALVAHVKADPNYKLIPLDQAADREWFYNLSEKLYTHKIDKTEFVSEGTRQFPGYAASFSTVADFLTQ
ncbi:MAG TPA: hypothetical protein VF457_07625 [Burkholderiaceae bacterium]